MEPFCYVKEFLLTLFFLWLKKSSKGSLQSGHHFKGKTLKLPLCFIIANMTSYEVDTDAPGHGSPTFSSVQITFPELKTVLFALSPPFGVVPGSVILLQDTFRLEVLLELWVTCARPACSSQITVISGLFSAPEYKAHPLNLKRKKMFTYKLHFL